MKDLQSKKRRGGYKAKLICSLDHFWLWILTNESLLPQMARIGTLTPVVITKYLPDLLLFDLIHKVEIAFIKMMHPNISIFSPTSISPSHRIHSNRIQGAKMALDAADLVFEDAMVEAGFKLALAGWRGCDRLGCLPATQDDKVLFWGDGCGIEGGVGDVRFKKFESPCWYYLINDLR